MLRDFTEQQIAVLKATTLAVVPWPDRVLGEILGVGAEQAGQIRARVHDQLRPGLKHVDDLAELVVKVCGRPVARHQVVAFLSAAGVPLPLEEQGADPIDQMGVRVVAAVRPEELASRLIWERLELLLAPRWQGALPLRELVVPCAQIDDRADECSDAYGLIREERLVSLLPERLAARWGHLQSQCQLRRIGEWVVSNQGLGDSLDQTGERSLLPRTALALALRQLGRPAGLDEISDQLLGFGLTLDFSVRAVLYAMGDVVRVSDSRWGFTESVDGRYEREPENVDPHGRARGVSADREASRTFFDLTRERMEEVRRLTEALFEDPADGQLLDGAHTFRFVVEPGHLFGRSRLDVPH